MNTLYIVIPCFNEEEMIDEISKRLEDKYKRLIKDKKIKKDSKILFVDDGSRDNTWNKISALVSSNKNFLGLKLSRNEGHQNALYAGLMCAKEKSDIVISMDADLQDDINLIDKMITKYNDGYDVVYAARNNRDSDSILKKTTAQTFYKLLKFLGVDIIYNHADYRLMSKRSLNALSEFKEVNLFLRGLIPLVGYNSCVVYYERKKRFAGKSKYPFSRMLSFALDGITSFSIKPLRLILSLGFIILIISIIIMIYSFLVKLFGYTVSGWTFIIISIWFIGGIQMISIGIIGEYIGKIYFETKNRPKYIIEEFIDK